jgi:hypothetical protein
LQADYELGGSESMPIAKTVTGVRAVLPLIGVALGCAPSGSAVRSFPGAPMATGCYEVEQLGAEERWTAIADTVSLLEKPATLKASNATEGSQAREARMHGLQASIIRGAWVWREQADSLILWEDTPHHGISINAVAAPDGYAGAATLWTDHRHMREVRLKRSNCG